jgi:tetratricopeptide (TPR) repeat protein
METGMERKSQARLTVTLLAVAMAFSAAGCAKLKARDDLNKGVNAFTAAQFDSAIEYFKQAKQLDPTLMNARLFLARAYAQQYIPGAPSDQNKRYADQAIEEWKEVLQMDPNNLNAIDGIGAMFFYEGSTPFDPKLMQESKTYHLEHMKLRPNDPEPYYWIGQIDYWIVYRANAQLRFEYNQKAKKHIQEIDPLPPAVRDQFIKEDGDVVQEGIDNLHKAIALRKDYGDAMAFLNLLLRQKGDMELTKEARDADNQQADALLEQVKEINQKKMTEQSSQ